MRFVKVLGLAGAVTAAGLFVDARAQGPARTHDASGTVTMTEERCSAQIVATHPEVLRDLQRAEEQARRENHPELAADLARIQERLEGQLMQAQQMQGTTIKRQARRPTRPGATDTQRDDAGRADDVRPSGTPGIEEPGSVGPGGDRPPASGAAPSESGAGPRQRPGGGMAPGAGGGN